MKNGKRKSVEILIKRTEDREGWYLAYHPDEFFNVTYSLYFQDTIMGAMALQRFAEMIRKSYTTDSVILSLEDEWMFHTKAVDDVIGELEKIA
jgi:hypothetical protein